MPSARAERIKKSLMRIKPLAVNANITACRAAQDQYGALNAIARADRVRFESVPFERFEACMIRPTVKSADPRVILYLHGGGYTAGELAYASGFGSILAAELTLPVLCVAYRLAPENPYPAALLDAGEAYTYLLDEGYAPENVVFVGESAGGGLILCLMHQLKALAKPLPGAAIALSPWTDLTCSGASYETNRDKDPTLAQHLLVYYAGLYAPGFSTHPFVSPLYGDFAGFPPALLFAGGDELLLSDVENVAEKLEKAGVPVELHVEAGMWHVYPLYGSPEASLALARMRRFLARCKGEEALQ